MNWTHDQNPPVDVLILVQYRQGGYEVLKFRFDSEYGLCASTFEGYVNPVEIQKWCLIT